MTRGQDYGTPFSQTATGSTSAVATQTGAAGLRSYITDISGSSDKDGAKILVKGTTVIWQDVIATTPFTYRFSTPLSGDVGGDVSVTVDGTSLSNANMSGYTL